MPAPRRNRPAAPDDDNDRQPPGGRPHREQLTVDELCAELKVARRTFYDWRAKGRAPRCLKLPNGDLRIRRVDLETWMTDRMEG